MTLQETGIIMDILSCAYPRFYADVGREDQYKTMSLWAEMFAEDDVKIVAAAVKALIVSDEKGFPPHIGAVKARIRQLTTPPEITEGEAWALVSMAAKRLDWLNPHREWDKLPEDVRRAIGDISVLVEWAKTDSDTFSTVIASNFQRSYRARRASQREHDALPKDVKKMLQEVGGVLAIGKGNP